MKKILTASLLIWLIASQIATAQVTPFSASWSFEGNLNGTSSTPLVTASPATVANILVPSVGGYPSGQVGKTVNLQNWTDPACPGNEYIEIKVSPATSVTMVLTTLSFYYSRSAAGPKSIKVKSSLDNFSTTMYTSSITATAVPYQLASINLAAVNSAFVSQTQPVSFRIYGCERDAINGTMRLDEITINATALPITLLSFTAKPEGDRVQLTWATAMEQDADRFIIERSRNSDEFTLVGEVAAAGTTNERQYYSLTDFTPQPGLNYYRLKQVGPAGTIQYDNFASATVQASGPVVNVYPNPAAPSHIHLRLWNADKATLRLLSPSGQPIKVREERRADEADLLIDEPLPPGLYWVEAQMSGWKRTFNVLVR